MMAAALIQQRFLLFRVARRLYALPADLIGEVVRMPAAARVPHAPQALIGIANLRGTVLPLVSLRALLGLPEVGDLESARAIVLATEAPLAMAVDAIEALVTVRSDSIKIDQNQIGAENGERLAGAFQGDAGVAKIIDVHSLIDTAFAERAEVRKKTREVGKGSQSSDVNRHNEKRSSEADILVTFDIADQQFGLPIDNVREIVPAPASLTGVAHSEALVLGMMVLRDELLPVLSLRGLLGIATSADLAGRQKIIVTKVGGATIGLMADRARAVMSAERMRIEPIPPVLAARIRGESKIMAVYRREDGEKLISILSPTQLFREDVMQRIGLQREVPAKNENSVQSGRSELTFLVFRLGKEEFGLPIEVVDEVARVPEKFTRVPKTPKFLEGVMNLRGAVLPVVDQRRRFDMSKLEDGANRRLIVVKTESHRAGIIVDGVSDILRSSASAIGATPRLTEDIARLVHGVINLEKDGRMVLLLNPTELLTRAERGLLDTFARGSEKAAS
jgi:purine-binding chemotaxis protein CheW